jgi:hypothetical protein
LIHGFLSVKTDRCDATRSVSEGVNDDALTDVSGDWVAVKNLS